MKLCGRNFLLLKKAKKNILAFTKSMKKYFSFLCSHKETKQRNAPAHTPPDRLCRLKRQILYMNV